MKTFFELRENVKTADKKPEVYTKPDGKKGVRMVPVDREVVKQEKNLEWLKAALEAQARKTKPCDEDVEETAEAKDGDGANIVKDKPFKGKAMKKEPDSGKGISFANMTKSKVAKDADANPNRAKAYGEAKEVDELNKSTLANYVKKASDDRTQNAYDVGKSGKMNYKGLKRRQGINRAVNKLAKEDKVDEVLDRPGALDSYRKKADASGNKARNSATRKILRGPDKDGKRADHSDELNTMRKRNKGQDMADRAANRHFRKSIGLGYNAKKESVELDENKFANKSAERHKEVMKQARADMKSANNRDAMVKAMNRYQSAKKAHDRATRASFDENKGIEYMKKMGNAKADAEAGEMKKKKVAEISNAKMGQYVRKATDDAARRAMDAGEKAGRGDSKGFGKQMVKSRQRVKGVQKAMDKMDKNRLYGRQ